jgi:hypothetical protein
MDGVGDGHADRVRQPPAALREPGDEGVGAAAGVGADQCLPSPAGTVSAAGPGPAGRR